jgi:hypothetical protein
LFLLYSKNRTVTRESFWNLLKIVAVTWFHHSGTIPGLYRNRKDNIFNLLPERYRIDYILEKIRLMIASQISKED